MSLLSPSTPPLQQDPKSQPLEVGQKSSAADNLFPLEGRSDRQCLDEKANEFTTTTRTPCTDGVCIGGERRNAGAKLLSLRVFKAAFNHRVHDVQPQPIGVSALPGLRQTIYRWRDTYRAPLPRRGVIGAEPPCRGHLA